MDIYQPTHKHCSKCKQLLSIENFAIDKQRKDGYRPSCKQCKSITDKNYRLNNKDKIKGIQKEYYEKNKEDITLKNLLYKEKNKERFKEHYKLYKKAYYEKNKEQIAEYGKLYRSIHKEKRTETIRKYYQNNKNKIREFQRRNEQSRYYSDVIFRLRKNTRTLIAQAFRLNGFTKSSKSYEILGCSFEHLKEHIENQFVDGMSWDNRSSWHIDHIIPISFAKTEAEVIKLNHYTNLQPLWAIDNLKKGNRV